MLIAGSTAHAADPLRRACVAPRERPGGSDSHGHRRPNSAPVTPRVPGPSILSAAHHPRVSRARLLLCLSGHGREGRDDLTDTSSPARRHSETDGTTARTTVPTRLSSTRGPVKSARADMCILQCTAIVRVCVVPSSLAAQSPITVPCWLRGPYLGDPSCDAESPCCLPFSSRS